MAIFQAFFGLLSRSLGKLLTTAFGWATIMLFGKVPADQQKYLSFMAFGSVAWLISLLGVVSPSIATFLFAFMPLPSWVDHGWVRIAMIVAMFIIPALVGAVSLKVVDPEDQPKGASGKAKAVLKGYPYTLGLALTLVMMTLLAPVMKVRDLVRRWTSRHVPIIVEPEDYISVLGDVERALEVGGIKTTRTRATWMLRLPTRVLTTFAGGAVENLAGENLTNLKAPGVQVLLHPSDMVISGKEVDVARARAILTEHLTFTRAYLTSQKESNELEDELREIWEELRQKRSTADSASRLETVEREIRTRALPYEEWEVLFREKLLVERGLLQVAAGIVDRPPELTERRPEEIGAAAAQEPSPSFGQVTLARLPLLAAVATFGVVAWRRLRPRSHRFPI